MSKYLRSEEFVPLAPKNVGTIHINHAHCPAGEDRKKRLYITRKRDGTVVAYCHHCSRSGVSTLPVGRGSRDLSRTLRALEDAKDHGRGAQASGSAERRPVRFPSKTSFKPEEWPKEVRDWYGQYGITDEEAKRYGFGFVLDGYLLGRLGLPCYADGVLNGIQFRQIMGTTGPKYLSRFNSGEHNPAGSGLPSAEDATLRVRQFFDSQQAPVVGGSALPVGPVADVLRNSCCVVEDVLSAIKVGRVCRTIACLTSTMPLDTMLSLAQQGYDTCYVWLDNDNTDVNRKAREIERRLGLIFKTVVFVSDKRDPKHYTDEEIRDALCKV